MKIDDILKEIFNLRTNRRRENIDDLKLIYELLGSPCKNCKIIHIAGTNGKGSTASITENILLSAGYNVCKFTSPHILKYNERIVSDKTMIYDEEIIKNYNIIKKTVNDYKNGNCKDIISNRIEIQLNFFEITTFIALLFFESQKPDFVIMETGLGGRLDATNILNSDISVITNITFDHMNILGNTLQQIAYEKAGIIKKDELCIFSDNLPDLKKEIDKRTKNSVNVIEKYKDMNVKLDKKNYRTVITIEDTKFTLPLFGKFQAYNFLLAYEIAKIYAIDNNIIQKGLNNIYWLARFEFFSMNPAVILDAAHNEDSIKKLTENLQELYKKNEVILITSLLDTKDFSSVFFQLENITDKIFITSLKNIVYGLSAEEIKEKMQSLNIPTENIIFEDNISIAYKKALCFLNDKTSGYKVIVICGSFYEISEFRKMIK